MHIFGGTAALLGILLVAAAPAQAEGLEPSEQDYELKLLGKYVFFDKISVPERMACATCHDPESGGTGFVAGFNLHQVGIPGADPHTVGGVRPPTNAYASLVPAFGECSFGGVRIAGVRYCGGNFWDGRAEGNAQSIFGGATEHLGPEVFLGISEPAIVGYARYFGPTSDQALNPMPGRVEQNIDRASVCRHVESQSYAPLYAQAWGTDLDCRDVPAFEGSLEKAYDISFKRIILAVGAWEHSSDLNSFSSRRDLALRAELACVEGAEDADPAVCAHPDFLDSPGDFPLVGFTPEENRGHAIFVNKAFPPGTPKAFPDLPAGNCTLCHLTDKASPNGLSLLERYTDDSYHNIGTPMNPELLADPILGLSGHAGVAAPELGGAVRTPTLRNVDKRPGAGVVKAYGHNGWFKSLESLVHFYNTSRVKPTCSEALTEREALQEGCWPAPEWAGTVAPASLIGQLGMTPEDEAAVVAYLRTLSDTHTPIAPRPYRQEPVSPGKGTDAAEAQLPPAARETSAKSSPHTK